MKTTTVNNGQKVINGKLETLAGELAQIVATQKALEPEDDPVRPIPRYVLLWATVNFMTLNNDKQLDSMLAFNLKKTDGTDIAFGMVSNDYFPSNYMSPNYAFNIQETIPRNDMFDLAFTITMSRLAGNDTWQYRPIVTLAFDDGTVITKKFQIDTLHQNQSRSFSF